MPRLSVWAIRTALLYLVTGFTFGGLMLFNKGVPLSPDIWLLLPAHIEFLLTGWIVQLIMGVAFWILPRFRTAPKRGNEPAGWLAYFLLNLGIWFVGIAPLFASNPWPIVLGRSLQASAALAFAYHAWPRVKPAGT